MRCQSSHAEIHQNWLGMCVPCCRVTARSGVLLVVTECAPGDPLTFPLMTGSYRLKRESSRPYCIDDTLISLRQIDSEKRAHLGVGSLRLTCRVAYIFASLISLMGRSSCLPGKGPCYDISPKARACMHGAVYIYIFIPLSPPLSSRCLDYKATWEHLDAVRPQSPAVTWANREQVTPYTPLFARVYPLCRQCFTMPCPSHTSNDFCALKLAGVLQPKWWYVHWSSRFTSYFFHHLLHSWIVLNIRKSLRKLLILSRRETWLDCYRSLAA